MIIEKKKVIQALKTENLSGGHFFVPSKDVSNCKVCAVGGVIRKHLGRAIKKYRDGFLTDYCQAVTLHKYTSDENVGFLLKNKNYLGALSAFFEFITSPQKGSDVFDGVAYISLPVDSEMRKKLVEFVKENFPTRFKVVDLDKFDEGEDYNGN